jgi:hypothetical protein
MLHKHIDDQYMPAISGDALLRMAQPNRRQPIVQVVSIDITMEK